MITNNQKKTTQIEMFPEPSMKFFYRLETRRIKEPDFPYPKASITNTSELLEIVKNLRDSDIEKMIVLYLDAQNQLIGIHITPGSLTEALIFSREIFKHALLSCAAAVILIHNHPSGHIRPSDADIRITRIIQESAKLFQMLVHDHLIVSDMGHCSFREEGLM